jgi:hypothetical protein
LNDRILARLGGDCVALPAFPPGWERAPELEDLRQWARALIRDDFGNADIWGRKDPRTCLTLPFWKQILQRVKYVACLRSPLDVAWSLERRNGYSLRRGVALWLNYLRSSLAHTVGEQRCLLFYDDCVDDWSNVLRGLAGFLGHPERAERAEIRDEARRFIDANLQHHRHSAEVPPHDSPGRVSNDRDAEAVRMAQQIYMQMRRGSLRADGDIINQLQQAVDAAGNGPWGDTYDVWQTGPSAAADQIRALIPDRETFILVDEEQLAGQLGTAKRLPFLEKDGQYWGPPPDDALAISELERLRAGGASFIVFAWPAFWWLDYYTGLRRYLDANSRCTRENDRIVVFDLRRPANSAAR